MKYLLIFCLFGIPASLSARLDYSSFLDRFPSYEWKDIPQRLVAIELYKDTIALDTLNKYLFCDNCTLNGKSSINPTPPIRLII